MSVKKNIVYNALRVGTNLLFPIIIFPYVSRVLGPDNIGKVNFATSVSNYFIMFASLGIPSYGVIVCAKDKYDFCKLRKTVCELLYINIALVITTYLIYFISIFTIPRFHEGRDLLILYSVSIFFTTLGIEWLYNAIEDYQYISRRSIVFKLLSLICIFLLVKDQNDYMIYAIILIGATVGNNLFNIIHAGKYIRFYKLSELNISRHYKPVLTFFAASVAGTINANTDSVMIGFIIGDYAVGIYAFSVKIKLFLTSIMNACLNVFIPRFATLCSQEKWNEYKNMLRLVFLITITIAIGLSIFFAFFSELTIDVLGGNAYAEANMPMIILVLCVTVLAATWTIGVGVLQPIGREKQFAKVMGYACIINIALNAILIPAIGVSGAALATIITESFNAIMFYIYAKDFIADTFKGICIWLVCLCAILSISITKGISILLSSMIPSAVIRLMILIIAFCSIYFSSLFFLHTELRTIIRQEIISIIRKVYKNKKETNIKK